MPLLPVLVAGALSIAAFAAGAHAQEEVVAQVKTISCTAGPYRLKLPANYRALRALGPIKREKTLRSEDTGAGKNELRSLRFRGLEFVVVLDSRKPGGFQVITATFSSPNWRIAGPLRVGVPAATALKGMGLASIPRDAELELEGETDSVRVTVLAGRVQQVEYDCGGE